MKKNLLLNNRNKSVIILFFGFFLLGGCAFFENAIKPDPSEFTNVVFDTSFDETWQAIQQVARSESLPINIADKELGVFETQKILEFNRKRLYRQYVILYAEIRRLSQNFTSVAVSYYITRYDSITHKWGAVSKTSTNRQKRFLNKVKAVLEMG